MVGVARTGQRSYDNKATGGSSASRSRTRWRSLRFTAVRTTAPPTALLTTKPARGGGTVSPVTCGSISPLRRWTTSSGRPARRPRRTAVAKSSRRLSRFSVGSTSWTCKRSGGQAAAALATAVCENRAAGTGTHAQTEAVGLGATAVVRLEGALAHSGAPEMIRVLAGHRLAVTVRPRGTRVNALVHRFTITDRDLCPSEAGGSSHRQLDLVTVRAATPSGQTGSARPLIVHSLWTTT